MKDFIIVIVVFFIMLLGVEFMHSTDSSYIKETPIVSLERNSETSGTFILGFGGISENIVYYAYSDRGQGEYELVKKYLHPIYGGKTYIKETDNERPSFIREQICKKSKGIFLETYTCEYDNRIVVPKGTIKKQFNL